MLSEPYSFLASASVIPVMVIDREADAIPMAKALVAGGIKVLEVTLRTGCALAAIKAIAEAVPEAHVGAGTVCNGDDFSAAVDAGARFIVSPGQSEVLFNHSINQNIPLQCQKMPTTCEKCQSSLLRMCNCKKFLKQIYS